MTALALPHRKPLAPNLERLSDAELTALLLEGAPGVRTQRHKASDLIECVGGLSRLIHVGREELVAAGLEEAEVQRVHVLAAIVRRLEAPATARIPMDAHTLASMFRPLLARMPHEELHVVLLDGRARYLARRRVAVGGDSTLSVHTRDLLAMVLESRVPRFALVHNHPAGECTPSPEDVSLSGRVADAARTLGLVLVDHLVIAADGSASAMPDGARWPTPHTLRRLQC